jgi:hypothetical protein
MVTKKADRKDSGMILEIEVALLSLAIYSGIAYVTIKLEQRKR